LDGLPVKRCWLAATIFVVLLALDRVQPLVAIQRLSGGI
jgi:hypothetical protein